MTGRSGFMKIAQVIKEDWLLLMKSLTEAAHEPEWIVSLRVCVWAEVGKSSGKPFVPSYQRTTLRSVCSRCSKLENAFTFANFSVLGKEKKSYLGLEVWAPKDRRVAYRGVEHSWWALDLETQRKISEIEKRAHIEERLTGVSSETASSSQQDVPPWELGTDELWNRHKNIAFAIRKISKIPWREKWHL